jgi:hypothetical protein
MGASTVGTKLCPHCANSIAEDASECLYCKAEVSEDFAPSWLQRDENSSRPGSASRRRKLPSLSPKLIWPAAMLVVAVLAFLAGSYLQRGNRSAAEANLKQLQAKDLMLQGQEAQLAQARQKLTESAAEVAELKAKLAAGQKELASAEQRLASARRPAEPVNRAATTPPRIASRAPAPAPQPVSTRQSSTNAGVYVTTRPTAVHEDPSSSSRVISQIEGGTRINVVGSSGGWLEVRSRRGNPPGYVRADDARPSGTN